MLQDMSSERKGARKGKRKKEKEAKEHTDKKRKHECVTQKWDKDRDKKYKEEVVELQRMHRPRDETTQGDLKIALRGGGGGVTWTPAEGGGGGGWRNGVPCRALCFV